MILETERLILRPWEDGDAGELYGYARDPRVGPVAGWQPHKSVDDSRQVIRDILSAPETYAVILKETGLPAGSVGLHHNDLASKDDEAELGYWLGVPYWGRGLIPEAAERLIRHAFEDLKLKRVWCGYYDGNLRSKRVQEKLGFVYQRTSENVPVPQMGETRKGQVNLLTLEKWGADRGIMVSKRCIIRVQSDEKMRELIARQTDPELKKAYGEMLDGAAEHPEERLWYAVWSVEADGTAVGDLSFKGLGADGTVEIGYGVYPDFRGKGYAAEAVEAATGWALAQPGVKRVYAETEPGNTASQRVLEKCGFVPSPYPGREGPGFFRSNGALPGKEKP